MCCIWIHNAREGNHLLWLMGHRMLCMRMQMKNLTIRVVLGTCLSLRHKSYSGL